jgi:hypothetical protein
MTIKQRAVSYLLQPPAVDYLHALQGKIKADSAYLSSNHEDIANILEGFLSGGGFHWSQDIFEREWPGILEEALHKLETGKS